MTIKELQQLIEKMYSQKDRQRGTAATFLWFTEEIGELASAIREGTQEEREGEFADVLAWLITLANITDIDLTKALRQKYGEGCPGCKKIVCTCNTKS